MCAAPLPATTLSLASQPRPALALPSLLRCTEPLTHTGARPYSSGITIRSITCAGRVGVQAQEASPVAAENRNKRLVASGGNKQGV